MPFRLPDKWVWDFWFARRGDDLHLFYLQAPRALGDSLRRHHHATVGHAISRDARQWTVLGDALRPGAPGDWDDLAIWTGSVIEHDGCWQMLYTGVNRSENGLIQRIGLATSTDLEQWRKYPANPLIESDSRWYETLNLDRWRDESWRDPWLFHEDGHACVLITARTKEGASDGAGVLAQARSKNLVDWEVLPPLTAPGEFAQVECPQLVTIDGRRLILFSCLAEDHSAARRRRTERSGLAGTFFFTETAPGTYAPSDCPIGDGLDPTYAGKLLEFERGDWRYLAFRGAGNDDFLGELTDPLPVRLRPGALDLTVDRESSAIG